MAEKNFWSWLNLGSDGQPNGEEGGGQRHFAASEDPNQKEYRKYLRSEAKTVLVCLFIIAAGLCVWYASSKRLHAIQLREDLDILVRRVERLEAKP